jgi:hypothetical protein
MPERLRAQQLAIAAYLRDPQHQPAPAGIAGRRLQVYRELYFNNLHTLLTGNFPLTQRILGTMQWQQLLQAFCRQHRANTPLFTELGQELLAFLGSGTQPAMPAWLPELAHYEWVELALQIADDPLPAYIADGDVTTGVPVLSPLAISLGYHWPVHRISPDYLPAQPPEQATLLLVRRDRHGKVRYAELSPLLARLLALLGQNNGCSGNELIAMLAAHSAVADPEQCLQQGRRLLRQLHAEGTILGTRP